VLERVNTEEKEKKIQSGFFFDGLRGDKRSDLKETEVHSKNSADVVLWPTAAAS
jgi:hypothetical protein